MFLKDSVCIQQEIKKSRFICLLERVRSVSEARAFLDRVRHEHPQATHCCPAWIIGSQTHSSDDGEPSGTAGRPMLDVLQGSGADQIAAVVVRYFGGTLLGKGGLVRAYSSSVSLALEQANWAEPVQAGLYEVRAPYSIAGKVEAYLRSCSIQDLECIYGDDAAWTFLCAEDLTSSLQSRFSGQALCSLVEEVMLEQ